MATNTLSPKEDNYVRMALLLTRISPRAVRVLFDKEFPPASITLSINTTTIKATLNHMKNRKVISQTQWNLLFPSSGITDSKTFDVTLMIALLRNLTTLVPPVNGYDKLPVTTETTPASDLARIKHYRNLLAHLHDGKVESALFVTAWKDISDAVLRLGGNAMKQEGDHLKTKPLDMSSQEILRDVQQANKDIEIIKQSLDLMQVGLTEMQTDMLILKSGHGDLQNSFDLLQVGHTESKKDIELLKSDHENLEKAHGLLHEQTVSKHEIRMVKEDVKTIQSDNDSLEKSHGLLLLDQTEIKIDVQNVKSYYDVLKTSQDLLQGDQKKTMENVKKLTSICEDPVPWNRRVLIGMLLDDWQENADNFVETRAAKCVLECIKENSCVTITASSGVGKTSILRHVALKMKKEGYDILPVTNPNDIIQFYNTNQKTLFVVDDFCGTYSINQSDLNNWESVLELIKMLIKNQLAKIIVACRLQVYQDEKFEFLSIFRTSLCNLQSEDLCLIQKEKTSIAEFYLERKASEIIQYCNIYDCFPLLCQLYSVNSDLNITDFFRNPFSVYETEIDNLYKKGHNTKYCALALCVMFNNNLKEELFSAEIDKEKRKIIKETCEACRLDRGTSRLVLLDELNLFEHTFIKKEQDVFKTKHDKLFDFLAYYFGQNMTQCLIKNAHSVVIRQRFLLERKNDMDKFITILPPKYHHDYMKRMIDDWSIGRVNDVFRNINLKTPEFRQRFLCYLKTFAVSFRKQLASAFDIDSNNTVLMLCCLNEYVPFIYWCIDHGSDVNLCNCYGVSPLFVAAGKGLTAIVKVLLDNNADIHMGSINHGASPLHFACQNNHIDTVKVLLENKADINKCMDNEASPLYVACQYNHIDTVKVLLDNKADINKCTDNESSPLYVACQMNHIEIVKFLLDNKADINQCIDDGMSSLLLACRNNNIEVVKVLLKYKADILQCNYSGSSPLYIACQYNHLEIVRILLDNKADINKCRHNGASPLFVACYQNHIETVKILLDKKADINKCMDGGVSPLYISCLYNNIKTVKVLLDNKADINKCEDNGASPLFVVCHKNRIEILKVFLNNKADINKCTDIGVSPLYIACHNNQIEIVKILLDNKADINKCADNGVFPLCIASLNNHIELVKILLDNKADINKSVDNGFSSLHFACQNNHIEIVKILLDNNADIDKSADNGTSPLFLACHNNHIETVKLLLDNQASINKCDSNRKSPLFIACQRNHIETVKVLLYNKADINKCDYNGISPLLVSCYKNHIEIVKVLLDNKADINQRAYNGASALYFACHGNHIKLVKLLLDSKADIDKCFDGGISPLFVACHNNHIEIVRMLMEKGADYNKCINIGISPLQIARENQHKMVYLLSLMTIQEWRLFIQENKGNNLHK